MIDTDYPALSGPEVRDRIRQDIERLARAWCQSWADDAEEDLTAWAESIAVGYVLVIEGAVPGHADTSILIASDGSSSQTRIVGMLEGARDWYRARIIKGST